MLNFAQFRLVTFDCYGTLIDWETGIFSALRPILAAHGKTVADSELLRLYSELESHAELGEFRAYREVLQSVVRGLGKRLEFTPSEIQIRSLPDSLPNWLPFPDTISALGKLKTRYQLAVISNVDDDLFVSTARRLEVPFDYVITVCDRAKESCPIFPGNPTFAHWGMEDPAEVQGDDATKREAFRNTAITLARRIDLLLALPMATLEKRVRDDRVRSIVVSDDTVTSPASERATR